MPQKRLTFGIRCSARFRITVFHISLLTLYRAIVTKSIQFVLHFLLFGAAWLYCLIVDFIAGNREKTGPIRRRKIPSERAVGADRSV